MQNLTLSSQSSNMFSFAIEKFPHGKFIDWKETFFPISGCISCQFFHIFQNNCLTKNYHYEGTWLFKGSNRPKNFNVSTVLVKPFGVNKGRHVTLKYFSILIKVRRKHRLIFVQSFARWSLLFICWCFLHWLSTNKCTMK